MTALSDPAARRAVDAVRDDPTAWQAAQLRASEGWRLTLDRDTATELAAAARAALARSADPSSVDRDSFEAPAAAALFARIHDEVEHGCGVVCVGGLPFDVLDHDAQVALTLGMADHVGRVVVQNYEGQRIVDVRDEGIPYDHRSRGYRSNALLPFHTDGANLFSLTCLGEAAGGGETVLASACAVYARLAAQSPDALALLERGFYHHRRGQHAPGEPPLSPGRVPVFAFHDGLLHCCYNRNPIEWAEREGVVLTGAERAALDALDAVLADEPMQLRLSLRRGESLFINNFTTLHSRTQYRDDAQAGKRRHMLRVWMNDPGSRRRGFSLLDLYVPPALRGERARARR